MIHGMVAGSVGRDGELKYLPDGTPVLSFSLASRRYDGKAKEEVTDWVSVSFFGKRAEGVSKHVVKGGRVAVRGAVHVRAYQHNGESRYAIELRADDVELLGKPTEKPATGPGPAKTADYPTEWDNDPDARL